MTHVTEQHIIDALKLVQDPDRGEDVVGLGMISDIVIKDGNVGFAVEVDPSEGERKEPVRMACEKAVEGLPGVLSATVVLTAQRAAAEAPPAAAPRGAQRPGIPGVDAIITVASGKGGVGKSTTAVNLALALKALGRSVGVLDADIYGPSIPRMLGLRDQRPVSPDGKVLMPMENYGVKCMSMGFLVDEDTPMIWRGPMVQSALEQLMRDVQWGRLDVMVIDMPPGTGDAQLTLAQRVPITGAVIVSTPQDIALLDARKGLNMFRKVEVPVFGIVENMSYFACPNCGHRTDVFSHGGARREAEALGIDFLGEIPLDIVIRETSDSGRPVVAGDPEGALAKAYLAIAEQVSARISAVSGKRKAPRIVTR